MKVVPIRGNDDQIIEAYDRGYEEGRQSVLTELSLLKELIRSMQAAMDKS